MTKTFIAAVAFLFVLAFIGQAKAQQVVPVDLSGWTAESYPVVSGFGAGTWTVALDGLSVFQSVNGQPTLFYSDFLALNTKVEGKLVVTGKWRDDDYIGFAIGFQPGDTSNPYSDYLLIDWKRNNQYFNFGSPSYTPGSTAYRGLAVSRVFGIPTADEFWGHLNFNHYYSDLNNGLEELARGFNLGYTGWVIGQEYVFRFEFSANSLKVFVNNRLEIDITGNFTDGRLAFYNFSQPGVRYSAFTLTPLLVEVPVDIKPQSCPNPLNMNSRGVLPVAFLGTADFDVTAVDPASVRLIGVTPLRSALEDVATYFEPFTGKTDSMDCTDEGSDGFVDLTLKFDSQEVVQAIEETFGAEVVDGQTVVLSLTGNLLEESGGTPIQGEDVVVILKKGRK